MISSISAKRVCMHVIRTFRTDQRVVRSATALKEAGYVVSVIDIVDQCAQRDEYVHGISVKHIKVSRAFLKNRFRRWAMLKALFVFIRGAFLILTTPADMYHAHDFTALPACYVAARLRGKPLIFDAHELPLSELDVPHRRWIRILLTPFLAHMISSCAGGIGAAPYLEKVLSECYHIRKTALIRNCPLYQLSQKNDRLRQKLGLSASARIALYQGNIQPDRRLDILVQAASYLEDNFVVVMLGQGIEPTITQLKALIASEGVSDRVKILPPVPYKELLEWTASADIGLNVLPPDYSLSIQKCLPNKVFEYLMAGLPVLTSQLDAVVSLVLSDDVGRVASSLEPSDLGAAINAMLKDIDGLERMRQNALRVARQKYNGEKEQASLIQFYQKVDFN